MIKHADTEKMPELVDEGLKKRKQQNIQTFKFVACGTISLKSSLPTCLLTVQKKLIVFP